ncbi:hypothetical protein NFI96_026362, partial [Prochilodus magdalenae]
VWFSRISGEKVEVKVRPEDNAVLYSDCNWKHGFSMVWFRNSSHEHMVIHEEAHPRYSIVWSSFSKTSDLLVRNVSESDLGLYYCALQKTRPIRDKARACSGEDVCLYGSRTTRLSFHGKVSLVLVNTNVFIACVWFSRISGADVEMRVRPGDDVVLHSDCVWRHRFDTVWFRNSSHEHMVLLRGAHSRYSTMSNDFHQTSDLLVKNVSESDLGLYFCALQKKRSSGDGVQACSWEDVCYYGNRTTRLSFHDMTPQTPSTPPVSDCNVCWKLLVSVCPVCVLLSSVVSSSCVYCIYRSRTKALHENHNPTFQLGSLGPPQEEQPNSAQVLRKSQTVDPSKTEILMKFSYTLRLGTHSDPHQKSQTVDLSMTEVLMKFSYTLRLGTHSDPNQILDQFLHFNQASTEQM